jgi:hypothetical protein
MRVTSTLVRIDGGAIGAARHQTIFKFAAGIEFARQKPTDGKQHDNNTKSDQRSAPIAVFFVVYGHYCAGDCNNDCNKRYTKRIALRSIFGVWNRPNLFVFSVSCGDLKQNDLKSKDLTRR